MVAAIAAQAAGIGFSPGTVGDYVFPIYLTLIVLPVSFLVARLLMFWYLRNLRKLAAELDEREREIQEHEASHNEHGTHQLVTAGVVIDFHVSGKAAEKQWVELQKMLTDWKQTQESENV